MSLVETWITATHGRGLSLTAAVEELNRATRSRYTLSRIAEWRRGVRGVPTKARAHMLREALPVALAAAGIKHKLDATTRLTELLT